MKKCLFLSNANYVLMQDIRQIAKIFNVDLLPCKNIFEVFEKNVDSPIVILVENEELLQILNHVGINGDIYFIKEHQVFKFGSNIKFDTFHNFFKSSIFCN